MSLKQFAVPPLETRIKLGSHCRFMRNTLIREPCLSRTLLSENPIVVLPDTLC